MQKKAITPEEYLASLPEERREAIAKLRATILKTQKGVSEQIQYGMLAYPLSRKLYPSGYHCSPSQDVPYISLASQKNHISLYHMGLYAHSPLLKWFLAEYKKTGLKLDMGKCCLRFKKPEHVPYELLTELLKRMKPKDYAEAYRRLDPRQK